MKKVKWLLLAVCFMVVLGALSACQNGDTKKAGDLQISDVVAEKMGMTKNDLDVAYRILNEKHEEYRNSGDLDAWKGFSSDWLVQTKNIRHEIFDDEMDNGVKGQMNILENIREILIDIWKGYNEEMNERTFDSKKMDKDKQILETLLEKFEY